jgi:hypothetical protein
MFLFTLLVTAAATNHSASNGTETPADETPAAPACASMMGIQAALSTGTDSSPADMSSLSADCQTCVGAALATMTGGDMSGVMACAPTPQPGQCTDMDTLVPVLLAAMESGDDDDDDDHDDDDHSGHDHGDDAGGNSTRRLLVKGWYARRLDGHGDPMMALAPECADYLIACMQSPEGKADGAVCFTTGAGMTQEELMAIAIPPACTLTFVAYLGSVAETDMGAALGMLNAVEDATCNKCLMAMAGASATMTDEEKSAAACACVAEYSERTGTTDPRMGNCVMPTPAPTPAPTTPPTTTPAPPADDSSESVAAVAALLIAYFA